MDLTQYVDDLRHQLHAAVVTGDEDSRQMVERLTASLDAAARLVLLDALSAAADEITLELAPGSVEVRLRGRDTEFVVTSPVSTSAQSSPDDGGASPSLPTSSASVGSTTPALASEGDDGATARLTLRMPEHLKVRIEDAAVSDGLSVNSWLVRAVTRAVQPPVGDSSPPRRAPSGGQRFTGWVGS
jgi:hypothetical protein